MSFIKIIVFSLPFLLLTSQLQQQEDNGYFETNKEYQVKAAFLFNFTQFVEWPDTAFSSPESPLVIGILGTDPFEDFIDKTVANEKVKGRPIVVKRYSNLSEVGKCHILFINPTKNNHLAETLAALKKKSVLTVGDVNGFIERGGIIQFFNKDNKINLRINPEEAKRANLVISSKLLRLSEIANK